jgi:hypothetical protein
MANYIKASLERSYAESFLTELERNENQYFFFIAKATPWVNESSPPEYTDTVRSEYDVMNNIIGYKKITPENVFYALPKYEWASGRSYAQYDDAISLFGDTPKQFYTITDENKVYKCLGNSGGVASTQKPTQVFSVPFGLSDGYVWQYLATVREGDLPYQLSDYFPIDYAYTAEDTETENQYNSQISAISSAVDRIVMSGVGASGVSAGVYTYTLSGTSSIRLTSIQEISPTQKLVTVTDAASRQLIGNPSNYVGYILRIAGSNVTALSGSEVNNYGVITNASSGLNSITFTVTNDAIDFYFTPPVVGNAQSIVTAEILPYVQLIGNGSGAYALPNMTSSKTIRSISVVNGGRDYSSVSAQVVSEKTPTTVHPTLTTVLSPKGGHGSNILKELNLKDIIIVVQINEFDEEIIRGGGTYRQFGIIKNPVLTNNPLLVAGSENKYYRDLFVIPEYGYQTSDFSGVGEFILIGDESKTAAKVISSKQSQGFDGSTVRLKTVNTVGRFITRSDRADDYILTFTPNGQPTFPFLVNEVVSQTIPSGTVFGNNLVYGYDLTVQGTVVQSFNDRCIVRVQSGGGFVGNISAPLVGTDSGITAAVSQVSPRYGEYIRLFSTNGENSVSVIRDGTSKLYKIVSVGLPYYDENIVPSYRGLHLLEVSTSISGSTGGLDVSTSALTQNSFSNGDVITQGSTAHGSNYGAGVVYDWEYVNPSYGKLYLTGVTGKFLSVQTNGLTGTTLGAYVLSQYHKPEIDLTSGEVLYIDNVRPIARITGQKEEFRLRLGF